MHLAGGIGSVAVSAFSVVVTIFTGEIYLAIDHYLKKFDII